VCSHQAVLLTIWSFWQLTYCWLAVHSYGFDPPAMKGWINLGLAQIGDGNCEVGLDNCNMSGVIDAWQHQQIPSLYGDLPIQWDTTPGAAKIPGAIFRRGYGLADGWESSLEALVAKEIAPQLGKSLRGVFLGEHADPKLVVH
jgi:hypothetical protein